MLMDFQREVKTVLNPSKSVLFHSQLDALRVQSLQTEVELIWRKRFGPFLKFWAPSKRRHALHFGLEAGVYILPKNLVFYKTLF